MKNTHGLPRWLKDGMRQLAAAPGNPLRYLFVRSVKAGALAQIYVVETLEQWLDTRGRGDATRFEEEAP